MGLKGRRPPAGNRRPESKAGVAARAAATALYSEVLDRRQAIDLQVDPVRGHPSYLALDPRDRRLARAIASTALRRHGEIGTILSRLIEKGIPRRSGTLARTLEIAVAQLLFMNAPDHAVVSIALEQIGEDRDARHFKALANAVLRRIAREQETLIAGSDAPRLNTPDWLWERWVAAYGEPLTRMIATANLDEALLDLTVKDDPEGVAAKLKGVVLPTGSVRLVPAGPIEDLPGYSDGGWWIQDAAAAIPARLLKAASGQRILDLCAAPGGKTAQLAATGAAVTAIDRSSARLKRLQTNLQRLDLKAEVIGADILEWTPREPFDAVLLDAPCSATGTLRRHPDAIHLKRPEDIAKLAELQAKLFDRAVGFLRSGGILVYSTCSLEPEEGERQFDAGIARHGLIPLPIDAGELGGFSEILRPDGTVRALPCHLRSEIPRLSGLDGFFVGRCQKP